MTEPRTENIPTEGWAWPGAARKAHYFTNDGRSLCRKWFYTGPLDKDQKMGDQPLPDDCVPCWRKATGGHR